MIRRHDILLVFRDPGDPISDTIAAGTGGKINHLAYAINGKRAVEMYYAGLRTVPIKRYKQVRIMRPVPELLVALEGSLRYIWREYRWYRYGWWQCFCQGVKHLTGINLPFRRAGVSNCSEFCVRVVRYAMATLHRAGEIFQAPADYYSPKRAADNLHMSPLYTDRGVIKKSPSRNDNSGWHMMTPEPGQASSLPRHPVI